MDAVERDVWELRLRLAALSRGGGGRGAVERFLALRGDVSARWVGEPSVLGGLRKSRARMAGCI